MSTLGKHIANASFWMKGLQEARMYMQRGPFYGEVRPQGLIPFPFSKTVSLGVAVLQATREGLELEVIPF
jgi:hypothetical protein